LKKKCCSKEKRVNQEQGHDTARFRNSYRSILRLDRAATKSVRRLAVLHAPVRPTSKRERCEKGGRKRKDMRDQGKTLHKSKQGPTINATQMKKKKSS